MPRTTLWNMGMASIQELETPEGILASGRTELFGCIFGRDSLISALGFLSLYERTGNPYFLSLTEKILRTLARLQGTRVEIESGEEPGKIIHEYRPDNHAHLTEHLERPWFVYPSGEMRSYDTVDATPLYLMVAYRYAALGSQVVVEELLPAIRAALEWLLETADHNGDGFADYLVEPMRRHGGLTVQSWMDSTESLFFEEGEEAAGGTPKYPIAPVEVQAYVWAAYRAWAERFAEGSEAERALATRLTLRAGALKERFNTEFVIRDRHGRFAELAFALDGEGRQLVSPRSSMGHVLFAARMKGEKREEGGKGEVECILDDAYIPRLAKRLLSRDLFVPKAGIRTLSTRSRAFDPVSYHNGSIWPHDTAMLAEGLANFGYEDEARRVREALLNAYSHFKTPVELFGYRRGFRPYAAACQTQAWSAAALLSTLAAEE